MLDVFLTDIQKQVQFRDYPSDQPVKFLINLKKIFPSTADLLLPVLPEDNNLENVTWESTSKDFETFKKLIEAWGIIELRLNALTTYKDKEFTNQVLKLAQAKRKHIATNQKQLSLVDLDYVFIHEVHTLIDAELSEIGEKFYLPTLREIWKDEVKQEVLVVKF
ncbi:MULTISPECIES: hypothetical protein [Acinetobacter]|uniref:Uncharacterized protein n=1 Tax=Acinetobacter baylyi (strain ATCC 33305 / BD413 / ADP1) TaxID=62977 RepID=Q6FB45_ACIAD|nr:MULTISPECIES: hypothetical protein [Acinetobacter]ENV53653.1 hypothetical protein F952_01705 [Acinetobacter baylyi DSM 14961 = CIP 107474]KAF2373363.1 hypothetical protein BSL88_01620 [Acinetobacter baylyi]KAF2374221.1 hypothetical protein BSL67_06300 [Acinetobacter baylyi]KAF2378881.1 hypothetical protein BSN81_01720 [Acinetobacter baylyi]KAF2381195.1 hypothetical protein BSN83_08705 [Acinetobacter baylyi]